MATVNEKLTNLADKIRVLSGTENAMGLDAMTTHVGDANDEVATQTDLLGQIATALEGKMASGEASIETCTLTIMNELDEIDGTIYIYYNTINDGVISAMDGIIESGSELTIYDVVKGSLLTCVCENDVTLGSNSIDEFCSIICGLILRICGYEDSVSIYAGGLDILE